MHLFHHFSSFPVRYYFVIFSLTVHFQLAVFIHMTRINMARASQDLPQLHFALHVELFTLSAPLQNDAAL